ncbi:MAG: ABC-F family ATP-binding cassette domain-containing protein [Clostridia bacterium]|nr:ABC-F family ATP-binding cassette domain-containing protein [Clostridia bacterium]
MLFKIINGAVSIGATDVLEEINFEIKDKEKIAIVGRNGAGKSTLLKVITGEVELSDGIGEEKRNLISSGANVIGYMKQNPFSDENSTMLEEVLLSYKDIIDLENKIEKQSKVLETNPSEQNIKLFSDMQDEFEFLGGYLYKKEYLTAIKKFGFTEEDKQKKVSEFSGGQRTRIAILKLILSKPDILILDEPTNHLDVTAVEWLQEYLANYKKSVVLVSHDRMFLDRIVNVVYEIEYGATTRYNGNYTAFTKQKQANYQKQLKDHEAQAREIDRLRKIADRFRYKPTKASMALSKLKQIERMTIIDAPDRYDMHTFHANFQPTEESVDEALTIKNLQVGYDKPLADISIIVKKGQKIGVIGANGTGKSTFLKTITGKIERLGGTFSYGVRVTQGYFDQQMALFTSEQTVFENFCDEFPRLNETEARNSLASFGFTGEDVFKKVSVLSGGEKVSLALCKIFKRRPNFLILDEPTNHMDIVNKETLERMLVEFTGTVIVVSHDRYLIDKVADRLIVFDDTGAKVIEGGYKEYERLKAESEAVRTEDKKAEKKEKKSYTTPLKEIERRKTEIKKLEKEISAIEQKIALLDQEITKEEVYTDYVKLGEIESERKILSQTLDDLAAKYFEKVEEYEIRA